jgi:prepilin-type N-terminal cleavage/methylation domain-containing protein
MEKTMSRLGFTLIELLIVITIIGILAVVFLPTVLSAPEKSRDAARKADVGNIIEGIEAARLAETVVFGAGKDIDTGCVDAKIKSAYAVYFGGGAIPKDPSNLGPGAAPLCPTNYYITIAPPAGFKYAVVAKVERFDSANVNCNLIATWGAPVSGDANSATWCYGAKSQ